MPEINDFKHFLVCVNSPDATHTVYGPEVIIDVESNTDYSVFVMTVDDYHVSPPSETLTFHVGTLDINEASAFNVSVYPNPAASTIYVKTDLSGAATANIIDLTGRLIDKISINDIQSTSINVENLKSGMYFLTIQQDNIIIVRKINIQ